MPYSWAFRGILRIHVFENKGLRFFDMIRIKCRKSANGTPVIPFKTWASWFLVPADALPKGTYGKKSRQVHLKKELSCLTKNSLRLQGKMFLAKHAKM